MNLKARSGYMAALAFAMMETPLPQHRENPEVNAGGDPSALKRYRNSKGIKEFNINGVIVYARNENNAIRKAKLKVTDTL